MIWHLHSNLDLRQMWANAIGCREIKMPFQRRVKCSSQHPHPHPHAWVIIQPSALVFSGSREPCLGSCSVWLTGGVTNCRASCSEFRPMQSLLMLLLCPEERERERKKAPVYSPVQHINICHILYRLNNVYYFFFFLKELLTVSSKYFCQPI